MSAQISITSATCVATDMATVHRNCCHIQVTDLHQLTAAQSAGIDELVRKTGANHAGNAFWDTGSVAASAAFSNQTVSWLTMNDDGPGDRSAVVFAAPVVELKFAGMTFLKLWTHDFGPLGTPLMAPGFQVQKLRAELTAKGYAALICPYLEQDSPLATGFADAGFGLWSNQLKRAVLRPGWQEQDVLSSRRRRKLKKSKTKTPLTHTVLQGVEARDAGFQTFCDLEALGWKGEGGSALKQSEKAVAFARALMAHHAAEGTVTIDCLTDHTPDVPRTVAMLICLQQAGRGVFWKISHDPAYDAVSPGMQVILKASERFVDAYPQLCMDSLATPDHGLINALWPDRLSLGTLIVPLGKSTLPAKLIKARFDGEAWLRGKARALRKRLRG